MVQLATEIIEFVELAFARGDTFSLKSFEEFQPAWIIVMAIIWLSLKQTIANFTPNSGRVIGLTHAFTSVLIGFPVLFLLASTSFNYIDMFDSFVANFGSITMTCNIMCYVSVGYFLMDSFWVHKNYLKHHIGAIIAWVGAAYHHETSIIHGAVVIAIFETGAILVQCSRMFPKQILFRTFVCCGYTATRLTLTWYYGFIFFTCLQYWSTCSLFLQVSYLCIFASLLFLLALNAKWTYLQWKALYKVCREKNSLDFYSYHQKIIGNTA